LRDVFLFYFYRISLRVSSIHQSPNSQRIIIPQGIWQQVLRHILEGNWTGKALDGMRSDGGTVWSRGRWERSAMLHGIADFYCIVDPQENFPGLEHFKAEQLISMARNLRSKMNERYDFVHPEHDRIRGLSHVMWTGKTLDESSTARNAVFYGDKAIDRSPCGTGTSARMAQWFAKGWLKPEDEFVHESFIGSKFIGRIEEVTEIAGQPAIVPSIEGWAKVYGYNTIILDDDDPYVHGFQVI
jgi:hypothetical protein